MPQEEKDFNFKDLFIPLTNKKAILWIIIVGLFVFFNSLFNGFVGDDQPQILNNPNIQSILNIPRFFFGSSFYNGSNLLSGIYYKPLMTTIFALIYGAFGPSPFFFHIFQVLIHISNCILLFLILKHFFNKNLSLILAIAFLVHPINAEAVDYISDLQDVLFFFFGSIAFYIELRLPPSIKKTVVVSFLILFSIFSKETGVLFMLVILLYKIIFNKKFLKQALLANFLITLVYVLFRFVFAHVFTNTSPSIPIMNASLGLRLLNVPSIILYYLKTTFIPIHLAIDQMWLLTTKNVREFFFAVGINVAICLLLTMVGIHLYRNYKNSFRVYTFFLFWIVMGLLFHLQIFFTLDATVSDRWFYFPFIGLLGIAGIIYQVFLINLEKTKKVIYILLGIVLLFFSFRTIVRNTNYYNNFTLYSHDIKYSKDNSILENALGNEYIQQKRYKDAKIHIVKSVQLDPNGIINWLNYAVLNERIGNLTEAKKGYLKSIKNGNYYLSYQNYAVFLIEYYSPKNAERFIQEALTRFPKNGYLWLIYALVEYHIQHKDVAIQASQNAAMYSPSSVTYYVYNRISNNMPVKLNKIKTNNGIALGICPPECE